MKKLLIILIVMTCIATGYSQQFNETIKKELTFEKKSDKNALMIANINGSIVVEGYDGDKVIVEVNKEIMAKTDGRLEQGKSEIQLGVLDLADTLILYVNGTCSEFGRNNQRYHRNERVGKGWNYNWSNRSKDCNEEYRYLMNFKVKVPREINLAVSTINDGDISVEKVKGGVYADNINGNIKLTQISGATSVSSINGTIDLEYEQNPSLACRYYSLNGDINMHFKKGLGASVSFESFNGHFFTNVDNIEALPAELEKRPRKNGVEYKLNGSRYKLGSGGVKLDIETFNGDAILKEL